MFQSYEAYQRWLDRVCGEDEQDETKLEHLTGVTENDGYTMPIVEDYL